MIATGTTVAVLLFDCLQGAKSMGTDIYLHAEKRSDGVWQSCGTAELRDWRADTRATPPRSGPTMVGRRFNAGRTQAKLFPTPR